MAWLVRDDEVLATVEQARSRRERRRGLRGRGDYDGVLELRARSVHTFGMEFPIDVAFCDPDGTVRAVRTLPPGRVTRPRLRPTVAYEARAGTFREWGLRPGDVVEVR